MDPGRRLALSLPLLVSPLARASSRDAQYHLTIPVPNAVADDVVKPIRAGK